MAILDHIVISTRFAMDRAEAVFSGLGFTLTPRGEHTLGSINHLMMFENDYLELVGIREADAHKRPEIANAPLGLDGLVFKSDDIDQTHARLEALGMAGDPPKSFSRPVTLDDGSTFDARFRTVSARGDAFPAGRLYFCEHLTPELIWRSEWQTHANSVTGFYELVIVTPNPHEQAASLAALLEGAVEAVQGGVKIPLNNGFQLTFQTRDDYAARFGDMARAGAGREAFLGALGLRCGSLESLRKFTADNPALRVLERDAGIAAAIGAFDTLILFDA
ncbi:MAG: VOC family protein [Alphaproteobacteria bacterium]